MFALQEVKVLHYTQQLLSNKSLSLSRTHCGPLGELCAYDNSTYDMHAQPEPITNDIEYGLETRRRRRRRPTGRTDPRRATAWVWGLGSTHTSFLDSWALFSFPLSYCCCCVKRRIKPLAASLLMEGLEELLLLRSCLSKAITATTTAMWLQPTIGHVEEEEEEKVLLFQNAQHIASPSPLLLHSTYSTTDQE